MNRAGPGFGKFHERFMSAKISWIFKSAKLVGSQKIPENSPTSISGSGNVVKCATNAL
jgi:hypothetical protein